MFLCVCDILQVGGRDVGRDGCMRWLGHTPKCKCTIEYRELGGHDEGRDRYMRK